MGDDVQMIEDGRTNVRSRGEYFSTSKRCIVSIPATYGVFLTHTMSGFHDIVLVHISEHGFECGGKCGLSFAV